MAKTLDEVARAWSELSVFTGRSKLKTDVASMVVLDRQAVTGRARH